MKPSREIKQVLSGILLVARHPNQLGILRRITNHIPARRRIQASSIDEANVEIMKDEPDAVIIDVTDFRSSEIRTRLEPFLLALPGWIRTFFIDAAPTPSKVINAAKLGVDGVLKTPISHHGMTTLLSKCGLSYSPDGTRRIWPAQEEPPSSATEAWEDQEPADGVEDA